MATLDDTEAKRGNPLAELTQEQIGVLVRSAADGDAAALNRLLGVKR